jgi:hypothetical protein
MVMVHQIVRGESKRTDNHLKMAALLTVFWGRLYPLSAVDAGRHRRRRYRSRLLLSVFHHPCQSTFKRTTRPVRVTTRRIASYVCYIHIQKFRDRVSSLSLFVFCCIVIVRYAFVLFPVFVLADINIIIFILSIFSIAVNEGFSSPVHLSPRIIFFPIHTVKSTKEFFSQPYIVSHFSVACFFFVICIRACV